jgi:hypothetical protein
MAAAKKAAPRRKTKEVTTRFKATPPKAGKPLSKPRPARAARASSHTVSLTGKAAELKAFITTPGKTLAEICKKFDWQPHSARAAISRINTKGEVQKGVNEKGESTYALPSVAS